jgi:hypothetical protein
VIAQIAIARPEVPSDFIERCRWESGALSAGEELELLPGNSRVR